MTGYVWFLQIAGIVGSLVVCLIVFELLFIDFRESRPWGRDHRQVALPDSEQLNTLLRSKFPVRRFARAPSDERDAIAEYLRKVRQLRDQHKESGSASGTTSVG